MAAERTDSVKREAIMAEDIKKEFEVLELMGIFWMFFGGIVLLATFFVKDNPYVPLARGVISNILGGSILFGTGLLVFLKGKANKRKNK